MDKAIKLAFTEAENFKGSPLRVQGGFLRESDRSGIESRIRRAIESGMSSGLRPDDAEYSELRVQVPSGQRPIQDGQIISRIGVVPVAPANKFLVTAQLETSVE